MIAQYLVMLATGDATPALLTEITDPHYCMPIDRKPPSDRPSQGSVTATHSIICCSVPCTTGHRRCGSLACDRGDPPRWLERQR